MKLLQHKDVMLFFLIYGKLDILYEYNKQSEYKNLGLSESDKTTNKGKNARVIDN